MRTVLGAVMVFVLACGATVAGQTKIDAKKLVGKWEPAVEKETKAKEKDKDKDTEKKDKGPPGPALLIEFAADNKMSMTVTQAGKDFKVQGTYKLDADKLTVQMKVGDKDVNETLTITKLTDDELVTKDSKDKSETMRRKK